MYFSDLSDLAHMVLFWAVHILTIFRSFSSNVLYEMCPLVCDMSRSWEIRMFFSFLGSLREFPSVPVSVRSRCWRAVVQEKKMVGLVAVVCLVDTHSGNPSTCPPSPSLWWWWPFKTLAGTRKGRGGSGPFYLKPHFSFPLFYNFFCTQLRYVNGNREVNHNYEK